MRKASDRQLVKSLEVLKGRERPRGVVVFSIMKDESFFIEAFFTHYRKLGADQFLILDDGSSDGTLEFLLKQPDTTVLKSSFRYGEVYERRGMLPWRTQSMRAGVRFKTLIPCMFLKDQWCVYADADEFLLLPSRFVGLPSYIKELGNRGVSHVLSSMVTFYPERLGHIALNDGPPRNFEELVERAPFFDFVKILEFKGDKGPTACWPSVLQRLLEKHRVPGFSKWIGPDSVAGKAKKQMQRPGAMKVSLFKPSRRLYLNNSHEANLSARADMLNCIAHFKFTPDIYRRVSLAIETKAWANESKKYSEMEALLRAMEASDDSFLDQVSVRFTGRSQLEECNNIVFPKS